MKTIKYTEILKLYAYAKILEYLEGETYLSNEVEINLHTVLDGFRIEIKPEDIFFIMSRLLEGVVDERGVVGFLTVEKALELITEALDKKLDKEPATVFKFGDKVIKYLDKDFSLVIKVNEFSGHVFYDVADNSGIVITGVQPSDLKPYKGEL